LQVAIRHPELVRGLLLWNVIGGTVAAQRLGYNYYEQFVEVAQREGMQGVIESEFFAERIQQNASNRERLLEMDSQDFISVMLRWHAFFTAEKPVVGASEAELRAIEIPTAIIPGNDEVHTKEVGENLHRILPNSELYEPVWTTQERETQVDQDPAKYRDMGYERMASVFLPFLKKAEAARVSVH
jgi:pimeloyl-ACP methyl ester carboxylesterase